MGAQDNQKSVASKRINTSSKSIDKSTNSNQCYEHLYNERETISDILPIGLAIYDQNGYQQFINPALASIFGLKDIEEHINKHINIFDDPIIPKFLKEMIRQQDKVEASIEYDLRLAANNNYFDTTLASSIYLSCRLHKIRDSSGEVQQMLLLISDLTEHEKKSQELQEAHETLNLALEAGEVAAWIYDVDKQTFFTLAGNALAGEGISREENMKMLHPEDHQIQTNLLNSIISGETEKGIAVFRYLAENGEYRYYESRMIPKKIKGKTAHIIGTQKDVTEWYELTEKLQNINKQNSLILNNINSGLVYISSDYSVIWENTAFIFPELINGRRYYETGKLCYRSARDSDQPCLGCAMSKALISKKVEHSEYTIPSGITFEIYANPILNEQNEVEGVILRIDNITQRKQIQQELEATKNQTLASNEQLKLAKEKAEQSDKLKSAFLANMSHEIRTPLNAIVGFSEMLNYAESEEEKAEYWDLISTNNELLLTLINDILDLSKIEAGYVDLANHKFDIAHLFDELATTYSSKMHKGISFKCDNPHKSFTVCLDKNRLTQIMTNFINNAIKFTKTGFIKIGYTTDEKGLKIYCTDTGIGISQEDKRKIFNRFEKLNDFAQGTGLGLSICKAIINAQGGQIGVESEPNKGSHFWAWIPWH